MSKTPKQSFILCSTPRTGSTLLCSLLKSTGVAGNPESYFRKQDLSKWALRWNLIKSLDESFSFEDYLAAAISAGSSNGVFSVRIMWGTLEELIHDLRNVYPECNDDGNLLEKAFGSIKFVYLKRNDVVAQAVSRLRAEQSDVWHVSDDNGDQVDGYESSYDFNQIRKYVLESEKDNSGWRRWFSSHDIEPLEIVYEELAESPVEEVRRILQYLDIDLPESCKINAPNKKMADGISQEWIERYLEEVT